MITRGCRLLHAAPAQTHPWLAQREAAGAMPRPQETCCTLSGAARATPEAVRRRQQPRMRPLDVQLTMLPIQDLLDCFDLRHHVRMGGRQGIIDRLNKAGAP